MTDNKYKNGKIYTIRFYDDNNLIYVGSTIQSLYKRFADHKKNANYEKSKGYNMLLYRKMRETNIEDWYIELYENVPCDNKEQLNKREGEVIREIATLNKNVAGRTIKEYYENNKEHILNVKKERHKVNQERYEAKKKEDNLKYYEDCKEYFKNKK
jgi:hypothetical protein